ncbi:MAG: cell division protein CrgA [Actinomycetota bacterium]|nr:cell division protein CrgA [Actinomycetota bacterium]
MPESKPNKQFADPTAGPVLSARFLVALVLVALGIAWILYYYLVVRVDPTALEPAEPGGPKFMDDLGEWNYLIGFGLFFLGLMASAHPKTPLGRGRGVVVGMLGCFILGLIWICTFYVISDDVSRVAIFNDLGQKNLIVGIAFMAVGFTFATRWE